MADDYGELVELGFEGVDRFAEKFHDPCHDYIKTHGPAIPRPHWHNKKGQKGNEKGQEPQPQEARSEDPAQQDRGPPRDHDQRTTRDHDRGPPRNHDRSPSSKYGNQSDRYAPDRTDDRDWDDRGRQDRSTGTRDRGFDSSQSGTVALRGRDAYGYAGGYAVAPLAPMPPPPPSAYAPRPYAPPYDNRYAQDPRRPIPPRRRESSYSPPRRREKRRSFTPPRQRKRSTSPNHHRVAATLVGALAGGVLGNTSEKANKWTTIAGAVVGGLGGRELEKAYDRRQDREFEEEGRRERRRSERERR